MVVFSTICLKGSRFFDVPSSNWWTISVGVVVDLFIDLVNGVYSKDITARQHIVGTYIVCVYIYIYVCMYIYICMEIEPTTKIAGLLIYTDVII